MRKILLASPVVSHPARSGNSTRVEQIVHALSALGCEVHFVLCPIALMQDRRAGTAMRHHFGERYHELNAGQVIYGGWRQRIWRAICKLGLRQTNLGRDFIFAGDIFPARIIREFHTLVERIQPDVILCEYAITAPLITALHNRYRCIVDTHDCFTNRNARIRATGGTGLWWSLTEHQERTLLAQFDDVIAIQESEAAFFHGLLPREQPGVVVLDILDIPGQVADPQKPCPQTIGFIGSRNRHNVEGLRLFLANHWPRIRQALPDVRLIVAGDITLQDGDYPGVDLVGRVDDLWRDFYANCAFTINPCVSGTGLKIKTVEAMSFGLPVVSTPEGCSGMESSIGAGILCHDMSSADFTDSCITLLSDAAYRAEHGRAARHHIESRYHASLTHIQRLFMT